MGVKRRDQTFWVPDIDFVVLLLPKSQMYFLALVNTKVQRGWYGGLLDNQCSGFLLIHLSVAERA
jgi:hypothetical protein